jgi:hypothetical protein
MMMPTRGRAGARVEAEGSGGRGFAAAMPQQANDFSPNLNLNLNR